MLPVLVYSWGNKTGEIWVGWEAGAEQGPKPSCSSLGNGAGWRAGARPGAQCCSWHPTQAPSVPQAAATWGRGKQKKKKNHPEAVKKLEKQEIFRFHV